MHFSLLIAREESNGSWKWPFPCVVGNYYRIAGIFHGWKLSWIVRNNNNAWARGWIKANKINELESYEVTTVDRGYMYHVYVAVWEAAVGQILPCKQEGRNIHDPYTVAIVKSNDTPIDNDAPVLNENSHS